MQFVRIVWELLGKWQRTFVAIIAAQLVYEGTKLLGPYVIKLIVDALPGISGSSIARIGAFQQIGFLISAGIIVHFVQSGISLALGRVILRMLYGVEYDVNCAASKQCVALTMGYHEHAQAGNTITRVDRGNDKLMELLHDTSWQGIPTLLQMIVTTVVMFTIDAWIGGLFLVFIPPFLAIVLREHRLVQPHRMRRYQLYEEAFGVLGESVWNMLTIQSFGNEQSRHERFRAHRNEIVTEGRTQYLIEGRTNLGKNAIVNIGNAVMIAAATWRYADGAISMGGVVLVYTLSDIAYKSLFNAGHLASRIADAHEGVTRLFTFLRETPMIRDIPQAIVPVLRGQLTFDSVEFTYPSVTLDGTTHAAQGAPILRGLSFTAHRGETIALVGPSGGGKSTIVKLPLRHYDVTSGRVLLDDHDIRVLDRTGVRQQLGYVPQEGQLFNGTIAENIRFGKDTATDDEVREAARRAGADAFIASLAKGYDTIVGEQGVHLSGGQRQRLCIARALIRKPMILIFDEATSHLDVESERIIQESLERLKGTMTMIVIAHRLSTIRHADRIHVVEAGRIIESGSYDELIALGGRFAHLAAIQEGTNGNGRGRTSPETLEPERICAPATSAATFA